MIQTSTKWHPTFIVRLALAILTLCSLADAQCPPFQPPTPLDDQYHDDVIDAALMVMCCGQCSDNDDIMMAASELLDRIENGGLYQQTGGGDWRAYTAPNTQCVGHSHWTTDPGNGIVINTAIFSDYGDPCALAVILGAALTHEYVHCVTFVNSMDLTTSEYDDVCGFYENEQMCYLIEKGLIECMITCGCAQCTGGGMSAIEARYDVVSDWYQYYTDIIGGCY